VFILFYIPFRISLYHDASCYARSTSLLGGNFLVLLDGDVIVGLHGVDFVVGELGSESLDEGVLISDLATLLSDLLLRLVELSSIGVLLESYVDLDHVCGSCGECSADNGGRQFDDVKREGWKIAEPSFVVSLVTCCSLMGGCWRRRHTKRLKLEGRREREEWEIDEMR